MACDPVGIVEICERLGVTRAAFDQWQRRNGRGGVAFPEVRWRVGGRPAWDWPDIAEWAAATRRVTVAEAEAVQAKREKDRRAKAVRYERNRPQREAAAKERGKAERQAERERVDKW